MSTETVFAFPKLIGTRDRAVEMASALPDNDPGHTVVVDARANETAASGFVDELVRQVLELRRLRSLVIVGPTQQLRNDFENSARRRNVFDPLRIERDMSEPLAHEPRTWSAFTQVVESRGRTRYRPIGPEHFVIGHGFREPVTPVTLVEDPHGEYMGWIHTGNSDLSMVEVRQLFRMQFPHGHESEVERGSGEAVPLRLIVNAL
jgi:hypothetical protein